MQTTPGITDDLDLSLFWKLKNCKAVRKRNILIRLFIAHFVIPGLSYVSNQAEKLKNEKTKFKEKLEEEFHNFGDFYKILEERRKLKSRSQIVLHHFYICVKVTVDFFETTHSSNSSISLTNPTTPTPQPLQHPAQRTPTTHNTIVRLVFVSF